MPQVDHPVVQMLKNAATSGIYYTQLHNNINISHHIFVVFILSLSLSLSFIRIFVSLSLCLSFIRIFRLSLSVCLSFIHIFVSLSLSVCLSFVFFVSLSLFHSYFCLSLSLSLYLYIYISVARPKSYVRSRMCIFNPIFCYKAILRLRITLQYWFLYHQKCLILGFLKLCFKFS